MHVHLKVLKRESKRCICGVCSWKVKRDEGEKKEWVGGLLSFPLEPSKACHLCFISTSFVFLSLSLSPQCAPDHAKPGCDTIHGTQRVLLPGIRLAVRQRCWDEGTEPAARGLWDCHDGTTPWSSVLLRGCELDHALCILCVVMLLLVTHFVFCVWFCCCWSRTLYSVCGFVVVGHALCILCVVLLLLVTHFVFCVWFCCCWSRTLYSVCGFVVVAWCWFFHVYMHACPFDKIVCCNVDNGKDNY